MREYARFLSFTPKCTPTHKGRRDNNGYWHTCGHKTHTHTQHTTFSQPELSNALTQLSVLKVRVQLHGQCANRWFTIIFNYHCMCIRLCVCSIQSHKTNFNEKHILTWSWPRSNWRHKKPHIPPPLRPIYMCLSLPISLLIVVKAKTKICWRHHRHTACTAWAHLSAVTHTKTTLQARTPSQTRYANECAECRSHLIAHHTQIVTYHKRLPLMGPFLYVMFGSDMDLKTENNNSFQCVTLIYP